MDDFELIQRKLELDGYDFEENYNLAFYLNALSVAGFPMKPIDLQEFTRDVSGLKVSLGVSNFDKVEKYQIRNKERSLKIQIPSGSAIRVLMCYIIYRIKRFNHKVIQLDDSFASFLDTLGVKISYKEGGSVDVYFEALVQLCHTYITVTDSRASTDEFGMAGDNHFIIDTYNLWWDNQFENGNAFIKVTDRFYDFVQKKGSPVDWNVIKKINYSAFKMDIYFWLATKTYSLNKQMQLFNWSTLYGTFGLHHNDISKFKKKFRYELKGLGETFPEIAERIQLEKKGLVVINKGPLVAETIKDRLTNENISKLKNS